MYKSLIFKILFPILLGFFAYACMSPISEPKRMGINFNNGGNNNEQEPCRTNSLHWRRYDQNYFENSGTPRTDLDWNDFFPFDACENSKGIIIFEDVTLYLYRNGSNWEIFAHAMGGTRI